ncbi:MAG TPA: porin [Methylotenera sp.]|jgi:phosphate-selective porin OprO/OprP|nr:porin [Methylotenera sp.]
MNFKLRSLVAAAVAGSFMMGFGANAMADSTDDILNALIAKGVLTEEEGSLLMKGRTGEKEAAEAKKKSAVSAKYKDGIVLETGDGKNSLQINGRIHADYRNYDYDSSDTSPGALSSAGADTFDIRRARIGTKFKFLDYYSGEIVTDFSSANKLDVAYLNIAWWKPAQIRIGQYKQPFSLEELTSSNNIDFNERSFADVLHAEKQAGAMVHGAPVKGFTYALSLANGENQNSRETDVSVDAKDIIGRATVNFAELMENKEMVMHVGGAFAKGDIAKNGSTQFFGGNVATEARGAQFMTTPTIAPVAGVDGSIDRSRYNGELALAHGPFKVQGQYINANYDYDATAITNVDADVKSYYIQALWTLTGESHASRYKDGVFGALKPKNNFNPETLSGGAWEAGIRYSKFDASDFKNANGTGISGAGKYTEADALTLGLKFVANAHVRFLLDYVKTDFENPVTNGVVTVNGKNEDSEKAILFRTQFAF